MNTAFSGAQDYPLVSGLDFIHKPEKYQNLVGRYPLQRRLNWLEQTGRFVEANNVEYSHFEENRLKEPIVMGAVATFGNEAGAGTIKANCVEIAVDASSIYTIDGTNYSAVRLFDRVEFTGNIKGLVYEVDKTTSTHYFYVQPLSSSYTLDATTVVEGDICVIMSNAQPEGADVRDEAILPIVEEITNRMGIIRDDQPVTSTEMNNATWVNFKAPADLPNAGARIKGLYIKAVDDMIDRWELERELKCLTDDINDSGNTVTYDGKTQEIRTTRGFIPHIEQYGNVQEYAGQMTLEDYNKMRRIIRSNHGPSSYSMMVGQEFTLQNTSFGLDLIKDRGTIQHSSGMSMDAVKLGFSVLKWPDGFELLIQGSSALDHADTTGAENLSYSTMAIAMPNTKVKDYKAAEYMDSYAIKYNPARGKGSRGTYKLWSHGGNSPAGTDGKLKMTLSVASEEGTQIYGAKQFVLLKKKAGT